MKRMGKFILLFMLCFGLAGCGSSKGSADITKSFKDIGYEVKAHEKDVDQNIPNDIFNLTKQGKDGSTQIYSYLDKGKVLGVVYVYMPADNSDYENMKFGLVYKSKDNKEEISEDAKKEVKKIFDEIDLTIEEFVEYIPDAYKENIKK